MWFSLDGGVVLLSLCITSPTVEADEYCPKGFYGPRCLRRCKEQSHCLNNDCVLLPSGRALNCSQGCKPGWRGLSCNTNCKHTCIKCDRYTGECVGACRDGYYGDRCYKYCPQHCVSCEKVSGSCSKCALGFYGEDCLLNCSTECEECDIKSGECLNRTNDDESTTKAAAYNRVVEPRKLSDGLGRIKLGSYSESRCAIITCVLVAITVAANITLLSFFYKRKGRNSGLEDPDSTIGSPLIKEEYEYQDTKYMKLGECVSPSTDYVYPNTVASFQHVNPDLGSPKGMINTFPHITPCPPQIPISLYLQTDVKHKSQDYGCRHN